VLARQIRRLRPRLVLLQHPYDLLFRKPRSLHLSVLQEGRTLKSPWRKISAACVDGPRGSRCFWCFGTGRVQSCVRPVRAALMTAGPDEVRESGSIQVIALLGARHFDRSVPFPGSTGLPSHHRHLNHLGGDACAVAIKPRSQALDKFARAPTLPTRCAPSCWQAQPPRPGAVAAPEAPMSKRRSAPVGVRTAERRSRR
jgi:hypothetical protein